MKEKIKDLYTRYGKVGLCTYMAVSTTSVVTIYTLLKNGVNIQSLLGRVGLDPAKYQASGTFIVALGINKLLFPARLGLAVWLTPRISRFIQRKKN